MGEGAPSRPAAWKRVVLLLLDTRPRWWLSLWLWGPLCLVLFAASAQIAQPANGWGDGGDWVFYQYGDEFIPAHTPLTGERDGDAFVTYWDVSANALVIESFDRVEVWVEFRASDRASGQLQPEPPRGLREAVAALDELEPSPRLASEADLVWAKETIADLIERGEAAGSRSRGPWRFRASRSRGPWRSAVGGVARVGGPLAPVLLLVVCSLWFVRASQLAAHRRALRLLDRGLCPRCSYDISGSPESPCPECGCDHHARRREAERTLVESGAGVKRSRRSERGARA